MFLFFIYQYFCLGGRGNKQPLLGYCAGHSAHPLLIRSAWFQAPGAFRESTLEGRRAGSLGWQHITSRTEPGLNPKLDAISSKNELIIPSEFQLSTALGLPDE